MGITNQKKPPLLLERRLDVVESPNSREVATACALMKVGATVGSSSLWPALSSTKGEESRAFTDDFLSNALHLFFDLLGTPGFGFIGCRGEFKDVLLPLLQALGLALIYFDLLRSLLGFQGHDVLLNLLDRS